MRKWYQVYSRDMYVTSRFVHPWCVSGSLCKALQPASAFTPGCGLSWSGAYFSQFSGRVIATDDCVGNSANERRGHLRLRSLISQSEGESNLHLQAIPTMVDIRSVCDPLFRVIVRSQYNT